MYHLYIKDENAFDEKRSIGDFRELDDAYKKLAKEQEKDKDLKYVIEETNGHFDNYGELISNVVDEN